jgi:hypothetical protein
MVDISSRLRDELRRMANGPHPGEKLGGIGSVRFVARCPFGASEVLAKAKSVLKAVDQTSLTGWPTNEEWPSKLPDWFVFRCAPEETQQQAEQRVARWRTLAPEEQARVDVETEWSLSNWIYWLKPENRQWFWWDAKAVDDIDHIILAVEVNCWPFPWGALRWLFKASGASALEAEE